METSKLSALVEQRIDLLFMPENRETARKILQERCGPSLPLTRKWDENGFERVQCAALKLSDGDLSKLAKVLEFANLDWRDLLMAAGFGHDVLAHKSWLPDPNASWLPKRHS